MGACRGLSLVVCLLASFRATSAFSLSAAFKQVLGSVGLQADSARKEVSSVSPEVHAAVEHLLDGSDDGAVWADVAKASPGLSGLLWHGVPVLHLACALGGVNAVRAMLVADSLSSLNAASSRTGATCLALAAEQGQVGVLHLLASAGKALQGSVRTSDGRTALHLFTTAHGPASARLEEESRSTTAMALIRLGADVNVVAQAGRLPPRAACTPQCVLSHELRPGTALGGALASGHGGVSRTLLAAGAKPSLANGHGATPLMLAVARDDVDMVDTLLKRGHASDQLGAVTHHGRFTPLHVAALCGARRRVVHALLRAGADVSATDARGRTAVHRAAEVGARRVLEAVFESVGAWQAGEAGAAGGGAAGVASLPPPGPGREAALRLLSTRDGEGHTAVDVACGSGQPEPALSLLWPLLVALVEAGVGEPAAVLPTLSEARDACVAMGTLAGVGEHAARDVLIGHTTGGRGVDAAPPLPALTTPIPPATCASTRILHGVAHPWEKGRGQGPPPSMPPPLVDAYTRCGAIPTGDMFVDDSGRGAGTHYRYNKKDVETYLATAARTAAMPHPEVMGARGLGWLSKALREHRDAVNGSRVIVFGSMQPVVEALVLQYGASSVTTVEYNRVTYDHPSLSTVTPEDVGGQGATPSNPHFQSYDVALSISSFDHDGLGRYGDPLCPDGDLLALDEVADFYLKPARGGEGRTPLCFLTVPVGPDAVVWNLHRRYGALRLPLLLHADNAQEYGLPRGMEHAGPSPGNRRAVWHIAGAVGWTAQEGPAKLRADVPWTTTYEPVWVLERAG